MVLEVPRWNRLNTIPTPGLRDLFIPPKLNQPWQRQWPDEVQSPKSLILFHPLHTVKERSLKSVLQRFHFGTASFLLKNKFPRCLALAQAVPALSVIRHSKKGSHLSSSIFCLTVVKGWWFGYLTTGDCHGDLHLQNSATRPWPQKCSCWWIWLFQFKESFMTLC